MAVGCSLRLNNVTTKCKRPTSYANKLRYEVCPGMPDSPSLTHPRRTYLVAFSRTLGDVVSSPSEVCFRSFAPFFFWGHPRSISIFLFTFPVTFSVKFHPSSCRLSRLSTVVLARHLTLILARLLAPVLALFGS